MNRKSNYRFLVVSLLLIILVSFSSLYLINKNEEKNSYNNAILISQIVQNSTNSFFKDEKNHEIPIFLNSFSNIKELNKIWFSKDINNSKDEVDKKALKEEEIQFKFDENIVRMSIPLKVLNDTNCAKCHNHGDILGTVSMEIDLKNQRSVSLTTIYIIPVIIFLTLIIMFFLFKTIINQYLMIFDSLASSLNSALIGRFKKIPYPVNASSEMFNLIDKFNDVITTFKDTSTYIDKKLKGFIGTTNSKSNSSFEASKEIISNLSNLYQFKKEIELDNTKEEIYNRLSEVFINQFNIKNFNIIQINSTTNKIEIIKEHGDSFYCKSAICENPQECRAARTKNDVVSIEYHHTCPYFTKDDKFHYCLSTSVSKNIYLIVNFVFDSKIELDGAKEKMSFLRNYINESAPSIEVKILMDALQQSAFKDVMTGLYNRQFLEEHTKKLIPQAKRQNFNIGVLLLDMDHFKAVNDEYGHDIGDKVLKELSRILTESVRESDIVIRYGGEEFMVLLVGVNSQEDALQIANKIRVSVSENEIDVYAGSKLRKTVSIGLSMFPQDASSFESAIKNADIALYEAKNEGRNKVKRFSKEQISSVELF